jgi:hypothetical protein
MQQLYRSILIVAVGFAAACGGNVAPSATAYAPAHAQARIVTPDLKTPILITLNTYTGALEYWPIQAGGGTAPKTLSGPLGIYQSYGLVGNGDTVAIANYSPAEVVTYNVKTKVSKVLSDTLGNPVDIAIDKHGNLYALNFQNVAVFKAGSSKPSELQCGTVHEGAAIAVDNEGNVYVNGYGPNFMGIVEFRAGSQNCTVLHLRAEEGYIGGVGVDPKTDALIVVDDPDLCAGGDEGRMIVYRKPYRSRTAYRHVLNAQYCSGTFRLNSLSNLIFYADATVSDGFPLIEQASYPSGKGNYGDYQDGYYPDAYFGGFTTIPNRLPN